MLSGDSIFHLCVSQTRAGNCHIRGADCPRVAVPSVLRAGSRSSAVGAAAVTTGHCLVTDVPFSSLPLVLAGTRCDSSVTQTEAPRHQLSHRTWGVWHRHDPPPQGTGGHEQFLVSPRWPAQPLDRSRRGCRVEAQPCHPRGSGHLLRAPGG